MSKQFKGSVEQAVGAINDLVTKSITSWFAKNNRPAPAFETSLSYTPKGALSGIKRLKNAPAMASKVPVYVDRGLISDGGASRLPRVIVNPAALVGVVETNGQYVRTADLNPDALFTFALHGAVRVACPPEQSISEDGKPRTQTYTAEWNATAEALGLDSKTRFTLNLPARLASDALMAEIKSAGLYDHLVSATVEPSAPKQESSKFFIAADPKGIEPYKNEAGKDITFTVSEGRATLLASLAGKAVYFVRKAEDVPVETTEAPEPAEDARIAE